MTANHKSRLGRTVACSDKISLSGKAPTTEKHPVKQDTFSDMILSV